MSRLGQASQGDTRPSIAKRIMNRLKPTGVSDREILAVLVSIVVFGVILLFLGRRLWFVSDIWAFLTKREIGSIQQMLMPHSGHWSTPTAVTTRVIYGLFGLDYWPWYFIPRVILTSTMTFLVWRTVRARSADPRVAFAAIPILTFLGTSGWLRHAMIGAQLVFIAALLVVPIIVRTDEPNRREELAVFGLLVLAVASSGKGVAVLGAVGLSLLLTWRVKAWWRPVGGAAIVYLSWYLWFSDARGQPVQINLDVILELPRAVFDLLVQATWKWFGFPETGTTLAIVLVGVLLWLAAKKRLDAFDGMWIAGGFGYLALVALSRTIPGIINARAERYSMNLFLFLAPVLLPKIKVAATKFGTMAILLFAGVLFAGNYLQFDVSINGWSDRAQEAKPVVESVGAMIALGEPYMPAVRPDFRTGQLTNRGLEKLLSDGWNPGISPDSEIEQRARANIRSHVVIGRMRIEGVPPLTARNVTDSCVSVDADEGVNLTVVGSGRIGIETVAEASFDLTWRDEFGVGRRSWTQGPRTVVDVGFVKPASTADVILSSDQPFSVCGVEAAPGD